LINGMPDPSQLPNVWLLLPVEMMVDGNRDGAMSFDDPTIQIQDKTTAEKPFRFWVNNDSDGLREGEELSGAPDADDNLIKSWRDLEDFTRPWITFKGLTEMIKNGGVTVQLEWKMDGGAGSLDHSSQFTRDIKSVDTLYTKIREGLEDSGEP
jgi:hypothetical protein